MTRQNSVANLIYLFLTNVQVVLFSQMLAAAPNLDPDISSTLTEQSSHISINEESKDDSKKESMSISEPGTQLPLVGKPLFQKSAYPTYLTAEIYMGPYGDRSSASNLMYGLDIEYPVDPSEKYHFIFLISSKPNPIISISRELYLRNIWKYLKSWNYRLALEVDSTQGLGSFLSLNHYLGGAGITLTLSERWFFELELLALSTHGTASEVSLKYYLF